MTDRANSGTSERANGVSYFDNAATTWPKPEPVYQAMDEFLRNWGANPGRAGHKMAVEAGKVVSQTRLRLARFLGLPSHERLVFTLNATDSLNVALKGLVGPGDEVITSSIEHNSVVRPLHGLELLGARVRVAQCDSAGYLSPATLSEMLSDDTKVVVISHASNVTGAAQPIEEIARLCHSWNALLAVDVAQSAGVLPIDVAEMGIDLLAFPGHKGLFGPPGTGGLYVGEDVHLKPWREGGTGSKSEATKQPTHYPDYLESGTANTVGLAGLGAGVAFIEETSLEAIGERETKAIDRLLGGLREIKGCTVYGPSGLRDRVGVVSMNLDGWEATDLAAILDERFDIAVRAGLHCAPAAHKTIGTFPAGTVRIAPGYFTTDAEIDRLLEALRMLAGAAV